jgi:hypothetical protein
MRDLFLHHIFFHSLIVYPELAWSPANPKAQGYQDWMLTAAEFKKILQSLYERQYILVRQRDFFTFDAAGQPHYQAPALPTGKRPLVLSLDDQNYYDYMQGSGFAQKLVLDAAGNLATQIVTPAQQVRVTSDGDCLPILENFIAAHPDFSFRGARGLIAVTGYEGLLGYRVAPDNKRRGTLAEEIAAVRPVIAKLKSLGWEFACHSYTHNSKWFKVQEPELAHIRYDTDKWKQIIEPLVGPTDTYSAPFGARWPEASPCHRYIIESGFKFYCNVGRERMATLARDHVLIPRVHMDGIYFKYQRYEFELYYGPLANIVDPARPQSYLPAVQTRSVYNFLSNTYYFLNMPTVYIWGGLGQPFTTNVLQALRREYPDYCTPAKLAEYTPYLNQNILGCDCSGLIKNFLMGGAAHFKYASKLDWDSDTMCQRARYKGPVRSKLVPFPELPGICLGMPGHVGIYVGQGQVIEATNNPQFGNGVLLTKLNDREWLTWFLCPGIDYGHALRSTLWHQGKKRIKRLLTQN